MELRDAFFVPTDAAQPPGTDAPWATQALPDSWRESRPGQAGRGWYRLRFDLDVAPTSMQALYISVVNTAYQVQINGTLVADSGGMEGPPGRNAGFPQWVPVPPQLLRAGANELTLRLRVAPNLRGGLTPLFLGPAPAVRALYTEDLLWRIEIPRAMATATLALGLLVLLLWVRQRTESVYGWFGGFLVVSAAWALRNFHESLTFPHIPSRVWETLVLGGLGLSRLMLLMFVLRYSGQQMPRLERWVRPALVLLLPLLYLAGESVLSLIRVPYYTACAGPMWLSIYLLARHSPWRREAGPALVLGALVGSELLAIHDWLVAVNLLPYGTQLWQNYGLGLVVGAMTLALAQRYFAAFATARSLNQQLEQGIARKTAELDANYRQMAAYEKAVALADERQRLIRDMHDGIGSQLITTVSAVERGQMAPPEVAALLRDCIDDLRIVFDSLEPAHGDLGLALASLRYRLAPRLKAAGLDSTWNLDALSDTPSLSPTEVLQVLRIVQEALTNVIKHSGAQHATLDARTWVGGTCIRVTDDGQGPSGSTTASAGRGLRNMEHRAGQIGATLQVQFSATGTTVELRLPRSTESQDASPAPGA